MRIQFVRKIKDDIAHLLTTKRYLKLAQMKAFHKYLVDYLNQ
jgi:hypothetical protein